MPHDQYSPWPQHGKHVRWEKNEAWRVVANFGPETSKIFSVRYGTSWPFFSFRIWRIHGYIGYKPVNLLDPHFQIPDWFDRNEKAVEFSVRLGFGSIS